MTSVSRSSDPTPSTSDDDALAPVRACLTPWGVGRGQPMNSVVYLIDRSGSMTDQFGVIQSEITRVIRSLESDQTFNLVYFGEGTPHTFRRTLIPATEKNRLAAERNLNTIVSAGQTELLPALRTAFALRPEVIYLITDGEYGESNTQLVRFVESKRSHCRSRVNVLCVSDDSSKNAPSALKELATVTNGGLHLISTLPQQTHAESTRMRTSTHTLGSE